MTAATVPEWLYVGAKVTCLRDRPPRNLTVTTVTKIGKRDVVCENGERFPVSTLIRRKGGTWGWTVKLVAADDPYVAKMRAEIHRANLEDRARMACDDYMRRKRTAAEVILALAPLTEFAELIETLFDRGDRS